MRTGRLATCCILCVTVFVPVQRASADPDGNSRRLAITNQPLGEDPHPRLAQGDQGDSVRRLQRLLNVERKRRKADAIAEDGQFGPETATALRTFQRLHDLDASSVADERTWRALEGLPTTNTNATNVPNATSAPNAPSTNAPPSSNFATSLNRVETGASANAPKTRIWHKPQQLSSDSLDALARIIEAEAGVCGDEGKLAVAAVVLNRARAGFADGTVIGVISERAQFSGYGDATYRSTPSKSSRAAARRAAAGEDPTFGATYYYNPYLVSPDWATTMRVLARIGTGATDTHVFLKP